MRFKWYFYAAAFMLAGLKPLSAGASQVGVASTEEERLSLDGLSPAGAVEWGPLDETPIVIFTDYRCPYSRAMIIQLAELGVHVIEYPISILGSRDLANAVICARDRLKAARNAYRRVPLPVGTCDTSGLDRNEAFAAGHGITEVPVLIRSDGVVQRGYLSSVELADWLNAAQL